MISIQMVIIASLISSVGAIFRIFIIDKKKRQTARQISDGLSLSRI